MYEVLEYGLLEYWGYGVFVTPGPQFWADIHRRAAAASDDDDRGEQSSRWCWSQCPETQLTTGLGCQCFSD